MKPVNNLGFPGAQKNGTVDITNTLAIICTLIVLSGETDMLEWSADLPSFVSYDGIPMRYPGFSPNKAFGPWQLLPLICAGIRREVSASVETVFKSHKTRLFIGSWNTYLPCGPLIWAAWLRFRQPVWARLVLWLCDLTLLRLHWYILPSGGKERLRCHMLALITAREHMPSWVSRLAWRRENRQGMVDLWTLYENEAQEYETSDLFRKAVNN